MALFTRTDFVIRYTQSGDNAVEGYVYATVLHWPVFGVLHLALPKLSKVATVTLLGQQHDLQVCTIPQLQPVHMSAIAIAVMGKWQHNI